MALHLFLFLCFVAFAGDDLPADVLTYQIGPGDEIHLEIVGQPDMSGDIRIGANGFLPLPLAGGVHVAGMTLDGARQVITDHLSAGYLKSPQVLLDVRTFSSKLVDVSGGVTNPATYAIQSGSTSVSRMILQAGGLLDPSAPRCEIWRDVDGRREVLQVDLERINKGDQQADVVLRAGDHLYVPQVEQIYVDGQVQKPGAIAWRDGMTLTEAVVQAGSTLGTARKAGVYIMRGEERIEVNLKRIEQAKEADFALKPSDRVVVPESPI